MRPFLAAALAASLFSCKNNPATQATLFEKIPAAQSGIAFENHIENSEDFNIFVYRNFYNGGGAAIGDINNDGLADVFFTCNMGDNRLYLNKGGMKFEDITKTAGIAGTKAWSTGVVMVDINADGWLDIYVCNAGFQKGSNQENELFINNHDGTFSEKAAEYGLNENGYTTHAAFFDYDGDGDLDCYILNNSFMPVNTLENQNKRDLYAEDWPVRDFLKGGGDKLLRNDGPSSPPSGGPGGAVHFTDVTRTAGIYGSLIGFGLGVTVGDVNGDNWPDLYVSNDFFERDYLYINQKNGTFKEDIENWVDHLSLASMGADMADINNDGYPEIFTTEMLPFDEYRLKTTTSFENYQTYALKLSRDFYPQFMQNCLQLNNRDGSFSEIANFAGVSASDWSWGALMFDMDGDGRRDIYVCNGVFRDVIDQDFIDFFANDVIQKMTMTGKKEEVEKIIAHMPSNPIPNRVFQNHPNLKFEDVAKKWGLDIPSFSNGAAYGDLDNDGDLDLVVNNLGQPAFLFENHSEKFSPKNHYITVSLKGKGANSFAIGAKVFLYKNGEILNTQLFPSRGFQSSVDYKMVFGLGESPATDSLVVVWPDKKKTVMPHPAADSTYQISWENATQTATAIADEIPQKPKNTLLTASANAPFEAHKEDSFVDFYQEGLSFRMISREGPKAATGDVNGDGLEDIFIGGAAGQAGGLYLQTKTGGYVRADKAVFEKDAAFEDTAAAFFDADGDKDLDLFVGSGGNAHSVAQPLMQSRIYLNDGKGHFSPSPRALPLNGFNTCKAIPLDFDGDGDMDLFALSRSVPGVYGVPPRQFLYQNDGKGTFRDVTKTAAPDFNTLGMICDAKLTDMTGDGKPELVVVGEWMPPQIFKIENGLFSKIASNLDQYSGWWYAVETADVDGDGDQDLILGNRGENFYFKGTKEAPAKLWVWDFDANGTVEKIMSRQIDGRDMPVPLKKEITGQIPSLKKKALKHADYAKKSMQDLFAPDILKQAMVREGNYFQSAIALNDGNGHFTMAELPSEVQFSCVCAIWCGDLDGDGKPDLVLGGNDSGFMPQFSKLDASRGHVLINKGGGKFERIENRLSGFSIRGDMKQLVTLKNGGKNRLLVLVNNEVPRVFDFQKK